MTFVEAVAKQEGFYTLGTRPRRNWNPGDIEYGSFAIRHGAVGNNNGYAVFANEDAGFAALKALFAGPSYKGLTVEAAINRFCPPPKDDNPMTQGNEPDVYVRNVCEWAGCAPDTIIDGIL